MELSSIKNLASTATAPADVSQGNPAPQDQRELIHAIRAVNAADLFGQDNELTFILDRTSRRTVVRIVNRDTHEVIQQIPAEYVLRLAEELKRG
ncbi:MAG: flagellar protein FlaG [Bryobacteraceae bacterium]